MKKCQAVARPAAHVILAMLLRGKGKVLPLLLVLALTACAAPGTPQETSASPSEGLVVLDEGTWPENIYTEGLTVPPALCAGPYSTPPGDTAASVSPI